MYGIGIEKVIGVAISVVVIWLVYQVAYGLWIRWTIVRIPGPFELPFLGNVPQLKISYQLFKQFIHFQTLYNFSPIFRLWLGPWQLYVVCRSPEAVEAVVNNNNALSKAYGYKLLKPWLGTGLLTSRGAKWHARRKLLTPAFHFSILNSYLEVFNKQGEILCNKLEQDYLDADVNIFPLLKMCTLDIISETAMGVQLNIQNQGRNDYFDAFEKVTRLTMERMMNPFKQLDFIYYKTSAGKSYTEALKVLHTLTSSVVTSRRNESPRLDNGRLPFLDLLLQAKKEDMKAVSDTDLCDEVNTFMFEGHDTTAVALSWCLFLLGHNADVQDNIYAFLRENFPDGINANLTAEDMGKMHIIDQCMKESLRLYTSVPFIGRQLQDDVDICGQTIPKGVSVTINILGINRDPSIYHNPSQFIPSRFSPEVLNSQPPNTYSYLPFSAGPRNCIGTRFAQFEEKVVLARLLRKFKFTSTQTEEQVEPSPELVLVPKNGIILSVALR